MTLKSVLVPWLVSAGLFSGLTAAETSNPVYWSWATTPPMGWNSWDCFATTVTEAGKANADVMADKLKRFGWQYIVVDIQWYEPRATGYDYRRDARLVMDNWGRLLPAENRFPSAANGRVSSRWRITSTARG